MNNSKIGIPDVLIKIVQTKKKEIEKLLTHKNDMIARCRDIAEAMDFAFTLKPYRGIRTVISEVKKASPSAGIIAKDFNPVRTALEYEKGGADAISVLTDTEYFKGSIDYLMRVKKNVNIPVLRKDFIISEEQIYEARCLGSDSFLLIVSILEISRLTEFIDLGRSLGMEPLVEIHNEAELEKALQAGSKIIGINNRNLRDFSIDINTVINLIPKIPDGKVVVGESGITSIDVAEKLYTAGCDSLLIGEFLMRAENKSALIKYIKRAD